MFLLYFENIFCKLMQSPVSSKLFTFKEKKKVLIKKIPINQYRFEVEVIAEKVEKPKKNNKNK